MGLEVTAGARSSAPTPAEPMPHPDRSAPSGAPRAELSRNRLGELAGARPGRRAGLATGFAVVAVLVVQVVLAAYYWMSDPAPSVALTPVWDAPVVVLLLAGFAALGLGRQRWAERTLVVALTVIAFAYFLIGLGQGFALREFGYDVVLRLHIAYVPELFRMMYNAEPIGWFVLYMALLALGVTAIVAVIHLALRHLVRYPRGDRRRQVGLAAGVVAATALGAAVVGVNGPISAEAYTQLDLALNLGKRIDATARGLEIEAAPLRNASPFARRGAARPTILLFVVESYGAVLFSDPDLADFPGWLAGQGDALTRAGYHVASKQMSAPVFGGSSWLAGTSLMCGVRIHNQKRFKGLMASGVRCLPAFMNEAGYRTVVAAGNIKFHDADYERRVPFEQYYIREDFGYRGPRMGWSFVPDQYVIDFVHRREIEPRLAGGAAAERPLLVAYFLTTSHHPWSVVPPIVSDWSKIGDGSIYSSLQAREFEDNLFVAGTAYKPAYQATIEYSIQTIVSYLERLPADDRSVILILGDHQPRRPVARIKGDPWTVPIHVVGRDPAVLERFARVGFRPGIAPAADKQPSGLEEFLAEVFTAYGGKVIRR